MDAWREQLQKNLIEQHGTTKGLELYTKYESVFPLNYQDNCSPEVAAADIQNLEMLSEKNPLELDFYQLTGKVEYALHFKLFQFGKPITLSDIVPALENLDLRIISEYPYKITLNNHAIWISDFGVVYAREITFDFEKVRHIFRETIKQTQRA